MITKRKAFIWLGAGGFLFYIVPLLIRLLKAEFGMGLFICLLLFLNPMYSFLFGLFCSKTSGFKWAFPVMIGVSFFISIFVYYNLSAWVYAVLYPITYGIGSAFGIMARRVSGESKYNEDE